MRIIYLTSLCIGIAALMLQAQDKANQPAFDAASVRIAERTPLFGRLAPKGGPGTTDPGRITFTQVSLFELICSAWDLQYYRIFGPDWLMHLGRESYVYNVVATMPPDTTKQQFRLMLQKLLTERFQIRLHYETRILPGYELVLAPGGAKLRPSAHPDDPDSDEPAKEGHDSDGFPFLPVGRGVAVRMGIGAYARFQNFTMADFVISPQFHAFIHEPGGPGAYHIVDKSGLKGKYDFTLRFDNSAVSVAVGPRVEASLSSEDRSPIDLGSGLPNIFKALEQQLGLKLLKVKGLPVAVIAIDHIERVPLEN